MINVLQTPDTQPVLTQGRYPSYGYNIFAVSSSNADQPQFQYVMDIVRNDEVISRFKQYPNPVGSGIFEPSRVINDYLDYDPTWTVVSAQSYPGILLPSSTGNYTITGEQTKQFKVVFGEEYGTSPSSSVTLYNGLNPSVPGQPAVTASNGYWWPGTVDPNNRVSWNYDFPSLLTDRPSNLPLHVQDYFTITAEPGGGTTTVTYKTSGGSTIGTLSYVQQSTFEIIPISPRNLPTSAYDNFGSIDISRGGRTITLLRQEDCNYDRVSFAFINKYGWWDYYSVNLPQKKTTTITREGLTRPFIDYSSRQVPYDPKRRGKDFYNIKYEDKYRVSTDWLDQDEAEWLSQMIESPSVFIQADSSYSYPENSFLPIVITNAEYIHNTNARSQKAFQYEIQYEFANQRQAR